MDEERSGMMSKDGNSGTSSSTAGSLSSSGKNTGSGKFVGEVSRKAFVAKTAGDGRGNLNEVPYFL